MYLTFRFFGWKPSDYFNMDHGERTMVHAFLSQYMDELKKEAEEIKNV